ncbi:type I polyketide synthase [Nostoc sp.]|uniref:type I polyketide synthase n=1 Tax=Nostoc sp. TaxID=1180 RepID=UPI002FF95E2C
MTIDIPTNQVQKFESEISTQSLFYLNEHRVQNAVVVPAAVYIETGLSVAKALAENISPTVLTNLEFVRPLILRENDTRRFQTSLSHTNEEIIFQISSSPLGKDFWKIHSTGKIQTSQTTEEFPQVSINELKKLCNEEIFIKDYYLELHKMGLEYGQCFQGIKRIWRGKKEAIAQIEVPHLIESEVGYYQFHPAIFDACLQVLGAAISSETIESNSNVYLPVSVKEIRLYSRPNLHLWSYARLCSNADNFLEGDILILDENEQVIAEVLGLCLQKLERNSAEKLDNLLYKLEWEEKAHPIIKSPTSLGSWLIFADNQGVGELLQSQLEAQGETCIKVSPGKTFKVLEPQHYQINPDSKEDFQKLLNIVPSYRGIIHLWSSFATTTTTLEESQRLGCISVLHLVQALSHANSLSRLLLITFGSQAVGKESVSVTQSALWGLGGVICRENPEFRCVRVDLSLTATLEEIAQLGNELHSEENEEQIALRGSDRYVSRLVQSSSDTTQNLSFYPDATYLVTGGLGGLGLKVSQWMVQQGARNLVLMSRSDANSETEQILDEIKSSGVRLVVVKADVGCEKQVAKTLAEIDNFMPQLKGIIHAAGILDDGILLDLNQERFKSVMAPKVNGAWNLHNLTLKTPLDFFVMFSSAASILGSPGQGNYVAANAFLDGLAHYRHAEGLPALSINWGPWSEVGMAARNNRTMHRQIDSITPKVGMQVLKKLLQQTNPQIAVMSVNWEAINYSSLLANLISNEPKQAPENNNVIREKVLKAESGDRQNLIQHYLLEEVAKVLRIPASKLDANQPLNDLGMDSLMAVELKNRIEADLGIDVPIANFLQGPSISIFATQLLADMKLADYTSTENNLISVDELSDDEVDSLLANLLN